MVGGCADVMRMRTTREHPDRRKLLGDDSLRGQMLRDEDELSMGRVVVYDGESLSRRLYCQRQEVR